MPEKIVSRRHFLSGVTLGLTLAASDAMAMNSKPGEPGLFSSRPKRTIRFAHFTDIHLDSNRHAPEGLIAALKHAQSLEDKPEMLITGGDHVMDSLGASSSWAKFQFALLKKVFAKVVA